MEQVISSAVIQIFALAGAGLASSVITILLTQALKWKAIAEPAKRYPRQVAAVLAFSISAAAVYGVNVTPIDNAVAYVVFSLATLLVATQTYDKVREAIKNLASKR